MSPEILTPAPLPAPQLPTQVTSTRWPLRRFLWVLVAALLLAAVLFEALKHGGWSIPLAMLGGIGPDLSFLAGAGHPHQPGQLPAPAVRLYNALHRPWLPLAVIVLFSVYGITPDSGAAGFTFGLAWLTHVAVDRVLGYGLRTPDGWRRS
jgi:hypothetical protein